MKTGVILKCVILLLTVSIAILTQAAGPGATLAGDGAGAPRIGTYDSRFVAVAYGNSPDFKARIQEMKTERNEAAAAGDTERVKELEKLGPWLQERLHMQGFGNLPVDDILAGREQMLAEVAQEAGVDIIVAGVAWQAEGVETVDVSIAIGRKLGCTEDLKTMFEEIKAAPPVELPYDFGDG